LYHLCMRKPKPQEVCVCFEGVTRVYVRKTKPKKVPPGVKFQSVEEMMTAMDSDESGSLDLAEWLTNLGQCAGLAAALAENVTVGHGEEEVTVAAEEVAAVGNMIAAGEVEMPSGEDVEKAAVKIQSLARGKRDRARVGGIKGAGGDEGGAVAQEAAAAAGGAGGDGSGVGGGGSEAEGGEGGKQEEAPAPAEAAAAAGDGEAEGGGDAAAAPADA